MKLNVVNETMDAALDDLAHALGQVNQCLSSYNRECQRLIKNISTCSRAEAEERFDTLFEITGSLSKAWFIFDVDIGKDLKKLVRNFERLHEPHTRDYWYKRFQTGEHWPA